jgi:Rad3-related DNA helicase
MDQLAEAYRELFLAAGGGALGLFTAISRLKAVHRKLIRPLAQAGLQLYAQHVDPIDTGTLLDMFRADASACLLGTDAVRDGVDVPGESLRLIVLDRVPWSQASILERARRQVFGGRRRKGERPAGSELLAGRQRSGAAVLNACCTAYPYGPSSDRPSCVRCSWRRASRSRPSSVPDDCVRRRRR